MRWKPSYLPRVEFTGIGVAFHKITAIPSVYEFVRPAKSVHNFDRETLSRALNTR